MKTQRIFDLLYRALDAAQLSGCEVDQAAQDKMKLYLDTYVVAPLREAYNLVYEGMKPRKRGRAS